MSDGEERRVTGIGRAGRFSWVDFECSLLALMIRDVEIDIIILISRFLRFSSEHLCVLCISSFVVLSCV